MIDTWYLENLVCPKDKTKLSLQGNLLISETGNTYPIVQGIPVMLLQDVEQTIGLAYKSLETRNNKESDYFLETLGVTESEITMLKAAIQESNKRPEEWDVDPVAQVLIGATNGILYKDSILRLERYPIPTLRLSDGSGRPFLDIGCSWGRWCIAAAQKNYRVIGLDPSLGAVLAGQRIARKLGLEILFVVGDARYLPFQNSVFDQVFSYSVIQHFSKSDAKQTFREVGRVLASEGKSLIQMPNWLGIRSLQHQLKRGFQEGQDFDVRYWSLNELRKCMTEAIGTSHTSIDGFFGLGIQQSDIDLLPTKYKFVVEASEQLRKIASVITPLKNFADSVYVESLKSIY